MRILWQLVFLVSTLSFLPTKSSAEEINFLSKQKFIKVLLNHAAECSQEFGCSGAEFMEMITRTENPSNKKKCFMACVMKKLDIITPDKRLNIQSIKRLANEIDPENHKVKRIVDDIGRKCSRLFDPHLCEAAFKYAQCIVSQLEDEI